MWCCRRILCGSATTLVACVASFGAYLSWGRRPYVRIPSRKRKHRPPDGAGGAGFALAPRRLKRPIRRLRIVASPMYGWVGASSRVRVPAPPSGRLTTNSGRANHTEW